MRPLPKMRSAVLGFTLIEIVMVLVLLGILSAVAVPKYFDLQEEAQAKACQHNRGVVLSAIHMQMSAAKIADDSQLFDDSSDNEATESAQKVLKDFAIKQPPLCPSGGNFDVGAVKTSDGNYVYHVYCSVHALKLPDGSADNDTVITKEHSAKFAEWLRDNFSLLEGQGWSNPDPQYVGITDLSSFFSFKRMSAEIDSEAAVNKNTMAATVADALKTEGIDTSQIIWRLNKENWPDRCQGVKCSGTIVVTIANKSDVIENHENQQIPVTQYKMKVTYGDRGTQPTLSLSDPKSTTALLLKKKNGAYWALKP